MSGVRLVDLSVPLEEDVTVYPGDPVLRVRPAATTAVQGYNVLHLAMGSQTGTHVDAPFHVRDDGAPIDALPLSRFLARLVLADVRGLAARAPITTDHVAPVTGALGPDTALVLRTGWSALRGSAGYFDHPWLHPDAADAVLALGVRTIGIDGPNLDPTELDADGPAALPVHQRVAAVGGVLVENLTGLDGIGPGLGDPGPADAVWLSVLPLRLSGADGAPCRAVALRFA